METHLPPYGYGGWYTPCIWWWVWWCIWVGGEGARGLEDDDGDSRFFLEGVGMALTILDSGLGLGFEKGRLEAEM